VQPVAARFAAAAAIISAGTKVAGFQGQFVQQLRASAASYSSIENFIAWALRATDSNLYQFMNALKSATAPPKEQLFEVLNDAYMGFLSLVSDLFAIFLYAHRRAPADDGAIGVGPKSFDGRRECLR
jgi:hypothetical protein